MIWIVIALVVLGVVIGFLTKPTRPSAYDKLQSGQSLDENDWAELRLWDSHFWNDFH